MNEAGLAYRSLLHIATMDSSTNRTPDQGRIMIYLSLSKQISRAYPIAADWAQQATHVLVLADFSLARAAFIILAKPLSSAVRRLSFSRPYLLRS